MSLDNKKSKFKTFLNWAQVVFSLFLCIQWPFWLSDGYLDTTYLKIATFIAAYGSFIGGLWWNIKNRYGWKSWKEIWNHWTKKK